MRDVEIVRCLPCKVTLTLTVEHAMPSVRRAHLAAQEDAFRAQHQGTGCKVDTGDGANAGW